MELQAPLQAFKALLRYVYSGNLELMIMEQYIIYILLYCANFQPTCLYSGHMGLSLLREDTVLDMLGLAHQFNFQELETAISDYLRQVLALRNVCSVLDAAR